MQEPKYEFRGVSPAGYTGHRYVCNVFVKDVNNNISFVFNDIGIDSAGDIDLPVTTNFTELAEKLYPEAENSIELGQNLKAWLREDDKILHNINAAYMKDSLELKNIMSYERQGGECHAELIFKYKGTYLNSERYVQANIRYPFSEVFDYPSTCQLTECSAETSIEKAMVLEALRKEIDGGMKELYFENSIHYKNISYAEFGTQTVEAHVELELYTPDGMQERTYIVRGGFDSNEGFLDDCAIEQPIEDIYDEFAVSKIEGMISYSYSDLNENLSEIYYEYLEENKDKGDYSYGYY